MQWGCPSLCPWLNAEHLEGKNCVHTPVCPHMQALPGASSPEDSGCPSPSRTPAHHALRLPSCPRNSVQKWAPQRRGGSGSSRQRPGAPSLQRPHRRIDLCSCGGERPLSPCVPILEFSLEGDGHPGLSPHLTRSFVKPAASWLSGGIRWFISISRVKPPAESPSARAPTLSSDVAGQAAAHRPSSPVGGPRAAMAGLGEVRALSAREDGTEIRFSTQALQP